MARADIALEKVNRPQFKNSVVSVKETDLRKTPSEG